MSNVVTVTKRNKFAAFTLVELLVVISIIAVLLAVLMPALNKAREQGRKVVCMTHVRGFVQGIHVYAQDYSGNIPSSNSQMNGALSYLIWQNYDPPAGFINFGRLYGRKIITDASVFYCPSQENEILGKEEIGWNYKRSKNEEKATSYIYGLLGQVDAVAGIAQSSLRLADLKQKALACDTFVPTDKGGVIKPASSHAKGFNVGYGDCHTKFFSTAGHPRLLGKYGIGGLLQYGNTLKSADGFVGCMFELFRGNDGPMRRNYPGAYP